jgi:uncharacterized membrane protein
MTDVDSQGLFWLYQIPNLALAALMYTLLGRFVLSLFFADGSDKVIWTVFRQITQPAVNAVQLVTPYAVHERVVVLLTVVWVLVHPPRWCSSASRPWAGCRPLLEHHGHDASHE